MQHCRLFRLTLLAAVACAAWLLGAGSGTAQVAGTSVAATIGRGDWWMFHHDPLHTGRSPNIGPAEPILKWKVDLGCIDSSPAIAADGTIYVGSVDGNVYAIRPDGTIRWKRTTYDEVHSSAAIGTDGTIYIGSFDYDFRAISSTGAQKWKFVTDGVILSSPAIGSDGTVHFGSDDGCVYAFTQSGKLKWYYQTDWSVYSSPAIGSDGTIYIGSDDGHLYAIRPNGTLQWRFAAENAVFGSPAVGPTGAIYVGSDDGNLYAVSPDGEELWHVSMDGWVESSPAVASDGTVYVGSGDGYLYAINPDGTEKWRFFTSDIGILSSPAIGADGVVYFGGGDGILYALNPDGTQKWRLELGYSIDSSPAIGADGTVYFAALDGFLYALGPGQTVMSLNITSPTTQETYETESSQINVSGTASSNATSVSWVCDSGGKGKCTGTASWSAKGIKLCPGVNTITFTASDGQGGTATAVLDVTTPSLTLQADPPTIFACDSTTLRWDSTLAAAVVSSNFGADEVVGETTVAPMKTTTYTITVATRSGKRLTARTSVAVKPIKPTARLTANPTTITAGQTAILSWSSEKAVRVVSSNFGAADTSGSTNMSPLKTTTYTITVASCDGNKATASAKVTVKPLKPTVRLTATPTTITSGQTCTLAWTSTNADSVVSSNFGAGSIEGNMELKPIKSTTYTIKVKSIDGNTASASAKVTVRK